MSIRIKTLIIICITFFILMTIIVTVSRIVILRGFSELEKESVELNVHRSIQSISEILSNLNNTAADWALWDDTYKFMTEHNADYITGNLMYETLINLKINFMMFFDLDSHLVEGRHIDLDNEKGTPFPHDLIEKIILLNNFLKQAKNKN